MSLFSSFQEDLSTPLHVACVNSDCEMVNLLLSNGAAVNAEDADGMTPILRSNSQSTVLITLSRCCTNVLMRESFVKRGMGVQR